MDVLLEIVKVAEFISDNTLPQIYKLWHLVGGGGLYSYLGIMARKVGERAWTVISPWETQHGVRAGDIF